MGGISHRSTAGLPALTVAAATGLVTLLFLLWGITVADRYQLYIATQFLAFVTAVTGLNMLYGYAGLASLGHGAFMALGAYLLGWGLTSTVLPIPLLALTAVVVTVVVSMTLVLPTLRVSGVFLVMVTLAYALIVDVVLINWDSVTGGPLGLGLEASALRSWVPVGTDLFAVALVVATVALALVWRLRHSAFGRGLTALEHPDAAACLGVPVRRYQLLAFVISAALASVGGMVYALNVRFLTPSEFDVMLSINLVVALIVGGSARTFGPVLGAAVVVVLPESIRWAGESREIILGVLLVLILTLQRGGLAGLIATIGGRLARTRTPAPELSAGGTA